MKKKKKTKKETKQTLVLNKRVQDFIQRNSW